MELICRDALVDALMMYTWRDEDGWEIDDAEEKREYIKEWLPDLQTVEPKRGHWVHVSGYFTPGGDPVWRCSECGKGIHVYGVEHGTYAENISDHQWVACPNCGAKMEGDAE